MAMRRLTLLRHGQAQPADSCPEDFERALTRRGAADAAEMASRLLRRNMVPDLILVSPAERTWATASIIAVTCELDPRQIECARELYLASPATVWRLLTKRDLPVKHILVCGHNPGLSEITSRFGHTPKTQELATAGLASAVWHNATWLTLQPETAASYSLDEPGNLTDLWV